MTAHSFDATIALSASASDNQHCIPPHTVYVSPSMSLIAKDTTIEANQTQESSTTENCADQNQTLLPNVSVEVAIDNKEDLAVSPIAIDIPSRPILDGSSCCRICMETVTEEDFAQKRALQLGCKYVVYINLPYKTLFCIQMSR